MKVLNSKSLKFLEEYLNNASPTGYESNGQKIWMKYLKPYVDDFITDNYGTAVGVINPDKKFKVVIEGHSDEISWYVNYITDNGLIYVIRNGGSDHQIAPSKWVNIHTKKGIVKGVFGWPAIHTRTAGKEEPPKLENISIDVGAKNKKEVDEFLRDLCTPAERKALEERWAVAQFLYDSKLSYRDIASKLKTSTTTVTRVARFLTNEPYKGYQKILKRINKWIKD